ncbi:MAG: acyl-CoA dehydrogenase family protein [Rhodospirillales bacterium]
MTEAAGDRAPRFRIDSDDERAFREEVRAWVAHNLPDDLRDRVQRPPPARLRAWHRALFERGWVAPHWPRAAGGMGASVRAQLILVEEMVRAGAPMIVTPGLGFVGPLLIHYGSAAQKARHLPPILRAEVEWAQGYSEPGAGSDLASLATAAVRDGDRYVVNGRKIWQTWGHHADWMFTLVRTDRSVPKHHGISCLLIDMKTRGVTVRPIVTIVGEDELSEVLLEDVVVPAENMVGAPGDGWRLANALLAHERLAGSNPMFCMTALARAKRLAAATGTDATASFRARAAELDIAVTSLSALFEHAVRLTESGRTLGPETSLLKLVATETLQAISDLAVEATGGDGADADADASAHFLQSRRATIFGGSREIHRNIVARRLLGLP